MKRSIISSCMGLVTFGLLVFARTTVAQNVPTDPNGGCPIPATTVASFFESGSVTLNGVAKPADSTQVLAPNCGFFQWSEQMFLWLTSPAPASYGGNSLVMFSPKFFTVSPPDSTGGRTFLPNRPGLPLRMQLRKTELGPHGLPALLSRSGQVIEVQRGVPGRPVLPLVRLQNGAMVRLGDVRQGPNGQLLFFDLRGRQVQVRKLNPPPVIRPRVETPNRRMPVVPLSAFREAIEARKFFVNRHPIFIDATGSVIDVEPGQADDSVLISQGGSLIYYITAVNDVFAYHRTMQGTAPIPFANTIIFPMNMTDANAVKTFAATKGHSIVDPQALAIETKSSWIEASSVPNPGDYLQVTATIPTFDKSDPNNWVPNGEKTVNLVMVGLHIVGSTNGHGEMVWGTFEHLGNASNATYAYNSTTAGTKLINQDTSGSWLFTSAGSTGPFNVAHARWNGTAITGSPAGTPIGSSAVLRAKPWGSNDGTGNPPMSDPTTAAPLNTQIISANASVIS